jgi:hypothetical protein
MLKMVTFRVLGSSKDVAQRRKGKKQEGQRA